MARSVGIPGAGRRVTLVGGGILAGCPTALALLLILIMERPGVRLRRIRMLVGLLPVAGRVRSRIVNRVVTTRAFFRRGTVAVGAADVSRR